MSLPNIFLACLGLNAKRDFLLHCFFAVLVNPGMITSKEFLHVHKEVQTTLTAVLRGVGIRVACLRK